MNDQEIHEKIMAKCDKVGDCILFQGVGRMKLYGKEHKEILVRPFIWRFHHGHYAWKKYNLSSNCGNDKCLNIAHLSLSTILRIPTLDKENEKDEIYKAIIARCTPLQDCLIFESEFKSALTIRVRNTRVYIIPFLWRFHHGEYETHSNQTKISQTCGNLKCVKAEHLVSQWSKAITKKEVYKRLCINAKKDGECLIRAGYTDDKGYGIAGWNGKSYYLHRLVYWIFSELASPEDIPADLQVCHLCSNKTCLRGEHYTLDTPQVNNDEHKKLQGTHLVGETHPCSSLTNAQATEIAQSWFPKGHKEYKTQSQRANLFGVSRHIVKSIDDRIAWHHIEHPNGKGPKKQKRRNLSADLILCSLKIITRLKSLSSRSIDGCWTLIKKQPQRYPQISIYGISRGAHIWAALAKYELNFNDLIGKVVRHKCTTRDCFSPEHVEIGTRSENMQDKRRDGTYGQKLKEADVDSIRLSNDTHKIIAARFGITSGHVRAIKNNNVWKV